MLSDAIQGAVRRGLPIDSLSSSKRDYLPGTGRLANVVGRGAGGDANKTRPARRTQAPSERARAAGKGVTANDWRKTARGKRTSGPDFAPGARSNRRAGGRSNRGLHGGK